MAALLAATAPLAASCTRSDPDARPSPEGPTVRSTVQLPADARLAIGRGASLVFSPDGRRLVFVAGVDGIAQLYQRAVDRSDVSPIAGTNGASNPFFSPDGTWLGFFADGKLKKVALHGGAPITIADAPAPRGEAWTPDGDIILTPRDNTSLWRVPAGGGTLEPFTVLADGDGSHRWPQVLPSGKGVMYTVWNGTWEPAQIVVQPPGGGARRVVLKGGGYGRFVAVDADRGYIVYAQPDIMAVPFDLTQLAVTGPPRPVADGVLSNFSGVAQFAVSASGALAYISSSGDVEERDLVWVDRSGAATPAATLRGIGRWFELSPDGTRVVRYDSRGSTREIRTENLVTRASIRISAPADLASAAPVDRLNAVWSADGRRIAYAAGRPLNLFVASSDGSGRETRLTTSANTQWPASFSPDGNALTYVELDPLSGSDIWVLRLDAAGGGTRPLLRTPFSESAPMISRDGRWLAYQSNESGRYEVYVQRWPDGGARHQLSSGEGVYPRWSPKGDELFYRSGAAREGMVAVSIKPGPEFRADPPRVLFNSRGYDSIFAPSPDGSRFLMIPVLGDQVVTQINLVINWLGDLHRNAS
jgi:serine/threonine-protein kinase